MSPIVVPERVKVIMSMIANAAERGDECPTNFLLANSAGCSVASVLDAIKLLETMNLVEVRRGRNWRVVTIVANRKSTAKPERCGSDIRASGQKTREANRRARIALFCDALSEGETIKQAGRVAGVSEPSAHAMMRTVRADLGWQAQ